MSFSQITSSPQQSGKSQKGLLREARKRYFAKYLNRSDKQLDSDYSELLRIVEILRFKVSKALESKLTEGTTKKRRGASVNPIKEIEKETQLIDRQHQNNQKRMITEESHLKKMKQRLVRVQQPQYRTKLESRLEQTRKEIAQMRQDIKQGRRRLEKNGSELIKKEQLMEGEAYRKLLRQLELQKQKLHQQTLKNQQLQQQIDTMKGEAHKPQERLITEEMGRLEVVSPQKEIMVASGSRRLSSRSKVSCTEELKLNQLEALKGKVADLDGRLQLVESHFGRAQLLKLQLERLNAQVSRNRPSRSVQR